MLYPENYGLEKKNYIAPASINTSFADFLLTGGNSDLSMIAIIQMYMDAMPFFNAIEMRAKHYSQIPMRVFDKIKKDFVDGHPSLELLNNPNADVSGLEFAIEMSSFLDITGNAFVVATGPVEKAPHELVNIPPQNITFGTGTRFGVMHVPDWIQVTTSTNGLSEMFFAEEVREGDQSVVRFYNKLRTAELWHIRLFNPKRNSGNFWGMSKARPIFLEIQQYLAGNNNNWSMLKRGTRLSVAWVNNRGVELTDTQWNRLQSEANKYKGDTNAGGTPILDGMDIKDIQSKNTDMQFKELQESMLVRISIIYGIPLAMLTVGAMTLNNLEVSGLMLYDNATLPHTNYLYEELTRFLLPRYDNSENFKYSFSEFDIPSLRPRLLDNATKQKALNVNTINEIRTIIGDDDATEGGDIVYITSSLVPAGTDFLEDPEPTDSLASDNDE